MLTRVTQELNADTNPVETGRNGMFYIKELAAIIMEPSRMVCVDGISKTKGKALHGGFFVHYDDLVKFCRKIIEAEKNPVTWCVREYASEHDYGHHPPIRHDCRGGYTDFNEVDLEARGFTKVNPGSVAVVDASDHSHLIVYRGGEPDE